LQVLQVSRMSLRELELSHVAVLVGSILFNACTSGNVHYLSVIFDLMLGHREVFCVLAVTESCFEILVIKDGSKSTLTWTPAFF